MTCIVGIVHKNEVLIGGDSAGVAGLSVSVRADEKVFHNGPFIMGFTSSFRMGQILRYSFKPPKKPAKMDDMEFMVTRFIRDLRKCFSEHGFGTMTDKHDNVGGTFLVGFNGNLYEIESDFQVARTIMPFAVVGCGADIALGALFATDGMEPKKRIHVALDAACQFSGGVRPPYNIVKQLKNK